MGKGYDKRAKLTRILLSDYLLLKELSSTAGISMAEALHKLIVGAKPEAKPEPEPIQFSFIQPFQVTSRVMPGRVTGNGVAHIQPSIIREVS